MSTPARVLPGTGRISGTEPVAITSLSYGAVTPRSDVTVFAVAVDRGDLVTLVERDAVLDVPTVAVDDDLLVVLLAGENGRQHDAVVVDARLGVEDRHLVAARCRFEQMLEHRVRAPCRCR